MYFTYSILLVFCAFVTYVENYKEGCVLNIVDTQKLSPILCYNNNTHFELAIPKKGLVNLNYNESILLACPGNNNYLAATNSEYSYANCIEETTLKILDKNIAFEDLQCTKRVQSNVKKTEIRCANSTSYIREIGYQITEDYWIPLIKVCYDDTVGVTFYSEHYLYGSELKYSVKGQDRPYFSTEGLGGCIPAKTAYTKAFQKLAFSTLLNSEELASRYITSKSYLARGHLAPNADFILNYLRQATFYFINATPQWQANNGGNWKIVEQKVKKVAIKYDRTFTILTGTYGILTLPDVNGILTEMYLVSSYKLPVPRFLWKIMYDPVTQMGIVIIVVNNSFLEKISKRDLICNNICDRYGWSDARWSNIDRGFIYCCSVTQFLKVVRTAPRLKVKGILRGNT